MIVPTSPRVVNPPAPLCHPLPSLALASRAEGPGGTSEGASGRLPWKQGGEGLSQGKKPLRRWLWKLSEGLNRLQCSSPKVSACCRARYLPQVQLWLRQATPEQRSAYYKGLVTCGSAWACPICAFKVRRKRAEEIRALVKHHGADRVLMLTLTVRHGMNDALEEVRRVATLAWKSVQQGKEWAPLKKAWGILGFTRALEVTHGNAGWHPHMHILLYLERPLSDDEISRLRSILAVRWQQKVRASPFGPSYEPDLEHGTDLRPVRMAEYLSKLGLELSDIGTKQGRSVTNRTPFQIAADIVVSGGSSAKDIAIWKDYCAGMYKAKLLNHCSFVQALRKALGFRETDEELAASEPEPELEPQLLLSLSPHRWSTVCQHPLGRVTLLEAAEEGGADKAELALEVMECIASFDDVVQPSKNAQAGLSDSRHDSS